MTNNLQKKIAQLVQTTERQLKWKVEYLPANGGASEIFIWPEKKKYEIHLAADAEGIDRLHELGHALFYDKYGVGADDIETRNQEEENNRPILLTLIRAVNDWFLEEWLMDVAREAQTAEIEKIGSFIQQAYRSQKVGKVVKVPFDMFLCTGQTMAQLIRFLSYEVATTREVRAVIDVWLSAKGLRCSPNNMVMLINKLAKTCERDLRVDIRTESGVNVWFFV